MYFLVFCLAFLATKMLPYRVIFCTQLTIHTFSWACRHIVSYPHLAAPYQVFHLVSCQRKEQLIDHFTDVCWVAWSWKETESEKPTCFSYANEAVLTLISRNLQRKSKGVSITTRSSPASLSFKDQATKHTTVKWFIELSNFNILTLSWLRN